MLILNHTYTSSINPLSLRDALPIWNVANSADEFECRLVAVDAAKVRGRANGSANVAAEREVSESGSERGCSATGGTSGRARKIDRKSTRLNSSHSSTSYAVFCLTKK